MAGVRVPTEPCLNNLPNYCPGLYDGNMTHCLHDDEFTVLKWPPQSPDLTAAEQLRDVEEQEIHTMDTQPVTTKVYLIKWSLSVCG